MMLWLRKAFAELTTSFYPEYSGCYRCNIRRYFLGINKFWSRIFGNSHITSYGNEGHGCFPLCEYCWKVLGTPEARLPYYNKLIQAWYDECLGFIDRGGPQWTPADTARHARWLGSIDRSAPAIRAAVKAGL
jgi:hypothetical protein